MSKIKYRMNLTSQEIKELEQIIGKQSIAQNIAKRAKIIIKANVEIKGNQEIGHLR